jgi:plastocyanin
MPPSRRALTSHHNPFDISRAGWRLGYTSRVTLGVVAIAVWSCTGSASGDRSASRQNTTFTLEADGSFTPSTLTVTVGSTVTWENLQRNDSIVRIPRVAGANPCDLAASYGATADEFSGPIRLGVPGIFIRGPSQAGRGPEVIPDTESCDCEPSCVPQQTGGFKYCSGQLGVDQYVVTEQWDYPWLNGALIMVDWNTVETSQDAYNWTQIEHELTAAAQHGKSVSLALRAGVEGIPTWLFSANPPVTPVATEDNNESNPGPSNCGIDANLASPSDRNYSFHVNNLILHLAAHIKSNAAWWQSLHHIRLMGINNISDEVKLPNSCSDQYTGTVGPDNPDGILDTINGDACKCNTKAWADAGYTPDELLEFFAAQQWTIQRAFGPHITIAYPLIQDGLPRVESSTNFVGDTLLDTNGVPLQAGGISSDDISSTSQVEDLIASGTSANGDRFLTMHNGLDLLPQEQGAASNCDYVTDVFGDEPVIPPQFDVPAQARFPIPLVAAPVAKFPGCPNKWAVNAGLVDPGYMTGFQVINDLSGAAAHESALWNLTINTNATYLEIYAADAWFIHHEIGEDEVLDPVRTSMTLGNGPGETVAPYSLTPNQWNDQLVSRRTHYSGAAFPESHSHTFTNPGTYYFYNPRTCSSRPGPRAASTGSWGKVVVE